jgi:hypothetical protein
MSDNENFASSTELSNISEKIDSIDSGTNTFDSNMRPVELPGFQAAFNAAVEAGSPHSLCPEVLEPIPHVDIDIAATYPQPEQAMIERIREPNPGYVPTGESLEGKSAEEVVASWTVQSETDGAMEVGEGVKEVAQRILDETGLSPSELIANSSVADNNPPEVLRDEEGKPIKVTISVTDLSEVIHMPVPAEDTSDISDFELKEEEAAAALAIRQQFTDNLNIERGIDLTEPHVLDDAFDPENPEHMKMLEEGLASGAIADANKIMEKPEMISLENVRETVVPIPTDLIREFFTNKGLYYLIDYRESKLKGGAFLTYLTNLNVPADLRFSAVLEYEEYAELMKAYMDQRSVINCPLLHVMAAELLLFAKGLPHERSPYVTPVPKASFLIRFIDENKEQIGKWLHFIDSTQVFALSAIKVLNGYYKPKEFFENIDDKEYVGSNIAQLYRIPEFIAYYFALEGAEYKLSYFTQQYEEYMFKNERLAKYFRSPHNFSALMFEHIAQGTIKASDIGYGLFAIGVFAPEAGIAEFDASAKAPA